MIPSWKRDINTHRRVGARLREIRERYGLTQTYVANVIGCSSAAISYIERGTYGSVELLESVLWAFGLQLGDLHLDHGSTVSLERAWRIREARAAAAAATLVEKGSPKSRAKPRAGRGVTRRATREG